MSQIQFWNECFSYSDGMLFWKSRPRSHFATDAAFTRWNKLFAGEEIKTKARYKVLCVGNKQYLAHKVIYEMHFGEIPDGMMIDHINQNKLDNRIENLRLVSPQGNQRNRPMGKNNTSGIHGVRWNKKRRKWVPSISVSGKELYLGRYESLWDAICARKSAEHRYGFHENHGSRASHSAVRAIQPGHIGGRCSC